MSDKKALLQAIAKEEALLSRLNSERGQALSRLNAYNINLPCWKQHAPSRR